jgi:D-alanyl-D-alanine carboxypeptidase (penicillin-binding protein 5/6)
MVVMKSLLVAFLSLFLISAHAEQPLVLPLPPAPDLAAKAYLLKDVTSGQVLVERNAHERVEPASLTKLMTAYVTFVALKQNRISLTQTLPVSEKAWRTEGSRMFIEPNKPVTVEELIHGMIVQSGNDACIALAEGIAGSEENFVHLMNQEALRLGMKNTHFANATGLPDPQHYSTAYDLSLLTTAIIRDFPEYHPYYSIKEYRYNNITQPNRNRLLWLDPNVDGMKTGHTESAGFCLITSAKRNNRRMVSVVLGTASDNARTLESQKLLNYGFQFYDTVRVYQKGQAVTKLPVWKGSENMLKAGFNKDFYITVPKGQYSRVKISLTSTQPLLAPINAGQKVGTARFMLDNKVIAEPDLLALEDVGVANVFGRAWDTVKLWFK